MLLTLSLIFPFLFSLLRQVSLGSQTVLKDMSISARPVSKGSEWHPQRLENGSPLRGNQIWEWWERSSLTRGLHCPSRGSCVLTRGQSWDDCHVDLSFPAILYMCSHLLFLPFPEHQRNPYACQEIVLLLPESFIVEITEDTWKSWTLLPFAG